MNLHANPSADDPTLIFELLDYGPRGLRRNRKSNADRTARGGVDCRVNTHHPAIDVESRPAGIAFVDGRINLYEIVILPFSDIAASRRDNPGGHGPAKSERITNRK